MRPNQQNNKSRSRGRNNNNGGRKHINPLSRNFESNGPDVKVRGNASHIAEKYQQLARDAAASGDQVMAENYLQHSEHYFRIVMAAQPQNQQRSDQYGQDEDEDFVEIPNRFAIPEPQVSEPDPQEPAQQGSFGQSFQPREQHQQREHQPHRDQQTREHQNREQPLRDAQPMREQAPREDAVETAAAQAAPNGEGEGEEPRRHRERRPRRRRAASGEGGVDPANAPQPEVGDLPAFITAGGAATAAE